MSILVPHFSGSVLNDVCLIVSAESVKSLTAGTAYDFKAQQCTSHRTVAGD